MVGVDLGGASDVATTGADVVSEVFRRFAGDCDMIATGHRRCSGEVAGHVPTFRHRKADLAVVNLMIASRSGKSAFRCQA